MGKTRALTGLRFWLEESCFECTIHPLPHKRYACNPWHQSQKSLSDSILTDETDVFPCKSYSLALALKCCSYTQTHSVGLLPFLPGPLNIGPWVDNPGLSFHPIPISLPTHDHAKQSWHPFTFWLTSWAVHPRLKKLIFCHVFSPAASLMPGTCLLQDSGVRVHFSCMNALSFLCVVEH